MRHFVQHGRLVAPAFLLLASLPAYGNKWEEGGGDAGSLPSSAMTLGIDGDLSFINGRLDSALAGARAGGDYQDVYKIRIWDPDNFSAETASNPNQEDTFNTQLWLFRGCKGVRGNDDNAQAMDGLSKIVCEPDEPFCRVSGETCDKLNPGVYFLAISLAGSDPLSGAGKDLFCILSDTEVSTPDGLHGSLNVLGWTEPDRIAGGKYHIILNGAKEPVNDNVPLCVSVPGGSVPAVSNWGAVTMLLLIFAAATVALRRRYQM